MNENEKSAIIIIAFNNSSFIRKQAECIKLFCKDEYDIIVIDNTSPDKINTIEEIRFHAVDSGCQYIKIQSATKDNSESHAFACNFSFAKFKDRYKRLFYLDHDNFPVKPFSIKEILSGNKVIAGLGQASNFTSKKYFWAGCVMFNNEKINNGLINFSPNHEFRFDTGGNLYKVIDEYGEDACIFFNETYCQNPYFNKSSYNFYSDIHNGTFMHFINGSNWAKANDNQERINSLLNILEEKIKQTI